MQGVTLPPWLSPWYGQHVLKPPADWYRDRVRDRARQRSRLTIYTYGHDDTIKLRLGSWWHGTSNMTPRPDSAWGGGKEAGDAGGWQQIPLDREPWHLTARAPSPNQHLYPEFQNSSNIMLQRINVGWMEPTVRPARAGVGAGGAGVWGNAARGWVTGAALLALLVLLARAGERCIERELSKRRGRSREWSRRASQAMRQSDAEGGVVMIPGLEAAHPLPAVPPSVDCEPPPPYSAAGTAGFTHKLTHGAVEEEPPPPYWDCFVQFSNKRDAVTLYTAPTQLTTQLLTTDQQLNNNAHATNTNITVMFQPEHDVEHSVQTGNVQTDHVQMSNVPLGNVQVSNVQSDDVQTSNVPSGNVQTGYVQTSNVQTDNVQTSNVKSNTDTSSNSVEHLVTNDDKDTGTVHV